ncbi:MAG TPA: ROK family protein, partial [Solirubrobacteraceae bacterium]
EPTPTDGGPAEVAEAMAKAMKAAAKAAGVETESLAGVGVGSPGDVDEAAGTVANARNLPNWLAPFALAETLSKALGVRVVLGNDVQVATDAEFAHGAGKPYDSVLGVFWGTGVGGGLILDGKPWLGRGGAGEIGHMVVRRGGAHCPCGRRGCMEAYAGRAAMEIRARSEVDKGAKTDLFKLMKERGRTRLTSAVWAQALGHEDILATELIDRAVQALGAGIASAVNLLDIEAVIIGGGLGVRFGQPMAERISTEMHPHLFNDARPPAVRVAGLGDLSGSIGAAMLVSRT